ncbi:MAG: hypothetical protein GX621_11275, partial [Pirellulaceae bacterium]|nr:hypothetical protein [Pirellulaceae bacterium]
MNESPLLSVIRTMREQLLAEYGDIDPTPQKSREQMGRLLRNEAGIERYLHVTMSGSDDTFGTAVTRLVNTPRTLKHVLRHVDDSWKRLHGEVCLDDLLVSTILRAGAPEAFDFLLRRIDMLRMAPVGDSDSDKCASEKRRCVMREDWDATSKTAEWDATSALRLILFLFPNAAKSFGEERSVDGRVSPQG